MTTARQMVRQSLAVDRRRLVVALRKAETLPTTTERRRHERDVLIGRRTRELAAHDRLIRRYPA